MAQVSANTLTYDQIFLKIREFFIKETGHQFLNNQERIQEYQKLLNDINNSLAGPMVKFNPYIKGEPPSSEKFNNFSLEFTKDVALIAKQIDYLNAKVINAFNLFSSEVETEKKYVERIASKAKVLQMYSKAPAEDLIYIGDSFDNSDQIDVSKIPVGLNPNIENGAFTLPISRSRPWVPRSVTIDTTISNGFLGNDHQVIKSSSSEQNSDYKYIYTNNRTISSLTSIVDSNPLTYFEYEGLNVDKSSNSIADVNLRSENEFSYISSSNVLPTNSEGSLINWSNFNLDNLLILKVILENTSSNLANSITITPYFGSNNLVKVSSIKAIKASGDSVEILNGPIYIGSSYSSLNLEISNNYFYNKATIKFSEIRVLRFEIVFEQDLIQNVEIQHAFWKPSYPVNSQQESPFYGLSRFNPNALSSDVYEAVQYDQYSLIPKITLPNEFKDLNTSAKVIDVRLRKKPVTYTGYSILLNLTDAKLELTDEATPSYEIVPANDENVDVYYYNWIPGETPSEDFFVYVENLADLFLPSDERIELTGEPRVFISADAAAADLTRLEEYLTSIDNIIYISQTNNYYIVNGVSVEQVSYTAPEKNLSYRVPIVLENEIYEANRKSIGIRDISIGYETYANKAEIVSTPYIFDTPIEALMLSVDSSIDNLFSNRIQANYYISVNNSDWIQVSPVQLFSNGVAEVLVFNKNVPVNYQIPGVAYLDYPSIQKDIKNIRVRIELFKDRLVNVTPSVFSYQLMVRTQR